MTSKICLIIFKNLAELEYLIPIFEQNKCKVDIIVFDYSKNDLIYKNSIMKNYLKKNKIRILDIKDFLKEKSYVLNFLSQKITSKSISIKSLLSILKNKFTIIKFVLLIKYIFNFLFKRMFNYIFLRKKTKNFAESYDFIFIGHRNFINSFFLKIFKKNFLKKNLRFVLIPHGPHYEKKFYKFLTDTENLILKENYINISANKLEKPWLNKFINKSRCLNMGYPPFNYKSNYFVKKIVNEKRKILVITRKFDLKEKISKEEGFTTDLKTFSAFMNKLKLIDTNKFDIFLKPHPTTDLNLLKQFLNANNLSNIKILFDPVLFNIGNFDLIYSYHSTLLLLGIANSKPVIYHHDPSIKRNVSWDEEYLNLYKLSYLVEKKNTKLDKYFKNTNFNYNFKKLHKNKIKLLKYFKKVKYKNFFSYLNKKFKMYDKTIHQ